jgi:hypothetical protein
MASMVDELTGDDGPDARFEFGLDVLVTGLAAVAAAAADPPAALSARRP